MESNISNNVLSPTELKSTLLHLNICSQLDDDIFEDYSELIHLCDIAADNNFPLASYLVTALVVVYCLICVLGLIGNSLVIYVILRISNRHTVTNTYILNLALADNCFVFSILANNYDMASMAFWSSDV